jgi:hypothetical protein
MHRKLSVMRSNAKTKGLAVPTTQQLEAMVASLKDMGCPRCGVRMVWKMGPNCVSLQHYRSGEMGLLCLSCNSRHQHYPGDTFMALPLDQKPCRKCGEMKPLSEFARDPRCFQGRTSYCQTCKSKWRRERRRSLRAETSPA